eukprot:scaffold3150_cov51-Attheya_sp.AAC.6
MVKTQLIVLAAVASVASAFAPMQMSVSVRYKTSNRRRIGYRSLFLSSKSGIAYFENGAARRDFIKAAGTAAVATVGSVAFPLVSSAEVEVPTQVTAYDFPTDWGLTFKYEDDAARVRVHMVTATGLGKGADKMEDFGKNMKKEMVDFVSYYRRFPKVAGKPSFSTLYTSINVLAGHYTSYGYKYPLPEKRRKRLYQEYAEIDKSLKRGR